MSTLEEALSDTGLAAELRMGVMRLRRRLAIERHPDNELSLGAMTVLGSLFRFGDMGIGDLAGAERVQPPSMTRTVTALENEGYLVRRPHETDRRQVVVSLTDLGRATLLADRERRDAWLARRLQELTPDDRETLCRAALLLQRLAQED
ncbi:MarR family winged helix-turn-helix transcriptional regulator [Nocardioides houyundeii]|uniref:MarR family winged helix-turn-helix transcriptional regulator n=1 Tax=Nocardioides houyundeii TaxID=2045452 RepID=UPI000C77E713|nr:MarR family transcriptional regulator [Nocardioides houyundeii]